MVSRPGLGRAISEALCSDCAFPCGQAPGRGPQASARPPLRLGGRLPERICPVGPLSNRRDGCGSGVRPGQQALPLAPGRTDAVRSMPSGSVRRAVRYAHHRVAVYGAPLSTLTTEWQCETHCHSTTNVPDALPLAPDRTVPYVHRRVAVYGVPSGEGHQRVPHAR